jgi:hypothetical protein
MPDPNFEFWRTRPEKDSLAPAVAAAGVLWATGNFGYPFPDDEAWILKQLNSALEGNEIVSWTEPDFFESDFGEHTSGAILASAWRRAMVKHQWGFRLKLRVKPSRAMWYIEQFSSPTCQILGTFVHLEARSAHIDWNWPVRIGFISEVQSAAMELELRRWIRTDKRWLEPLIQFVNVGKRQRVVDFLFFGRGASVLSSLRNALTPVRANCLCLLESLRESRRIGSRAHPRCA